MENTPALCVSPADIDTLCEEVEKLSHTSDSTLVSDDPTLIAQRHRMSMQFYGLIRPPPLKYCKRLELFESPIHGRGVRSDVAIPPQCCITHYPCHAVGDRYDLYITDETQCSLLFKRDLLQYAATHGFTIPADIPEADDAKTNTIMPPSFEQMVVQSAWRCIGDPHSPDPVSPLLMGHMINDAYGNIFDQCPDDVKELSNIVFRNTVMAYLINSSRKVNCRFTVNKARTCVTVVSTKLITPSQELLVSYGAYYWFLVRYTKYGERVTGEVPQHIYEEGKRLFDALYSDKDFIAWQEQCEFIENAIK